MDWPNVLKLVICLIACLAAGGLGGLFTTKNIPSWYAGLKKPPFTPPNRVFGPVWTALYILMAISIYLVWRNGLSEPVVLTAFILFWIQLIFNILWSLVFFGLKSPGRGVIVIVVLWLLILAVVITAFRVSAWAGGLLLPYLIWVTVAGYLNIGVWRLNIQPRQ